MTNNVFVQLQGIVERSLMAVANLSKSFRKFFIVTMILCTMTTRMNYSHMERFGKSANIHLADTGFKDYCCSVSGMPVDV